MTPLVCAANCLIIATSTLGDDSISIKLQSPLVRVAQAEVRMPDDVRSLLQSQPSFEERKLTHVPGSTTAPSLTPQTLKEEQVKHLIDELDRSHGAEPGAVQIAPSAGNNYKLNYDLTKLNKSFAARLKSSAGAGLGGDPDHVEASASAEYRVESSPSGSERVIAVKRDNDVLGTALRSGTEPVSVNVNSLGLSARQIPGSDDKLPVEVTVGAQKQQLNSGETGHFGDLDVVIQDSSNRSAAGGVIEGSPYSLRVKVQSAP